MSNDRTIISDKIVDEQQIFQDPNEFSIYIETKAVENHQTCLEALVDFIESKDIEIDTIVDIISPSLRDKLKENFIEAGLMKAQNTLTDFFE